MQCLALSPHNEKVPGSILGQGVSVQNLRVHPVCVCAWMDGNLSL